MTVINHTTAALLTVAVAQLAKLNRESKKNGGEPMFKLGTDLGNGVTWRELSNWAKEQKAKAASVAPTTKPVAPKTETKPSAKAANNSAPGEFTTAELKGANLLVGRTREKIKSVVKAPEGNRVVVLETGVRIPVANLELNNRGTLRVKLGMEPGAVKTPAVKPATTATVKPAPKAANNSEVVELKGTEIRDQEVSVGRSKEKVIRIVRDHKLDARVAVTDKGSRILLADIERNNRGNLRVKLGKENAVVKTAPKAAPMKEGVKQIEVGTSTNIAGASYEKARKVLTVTFHSGAVYEYKNVSLKDIKEFEAAPSKGAHISKVIKPAKDVVCVVKGAPRKAKAA